MDPGARVRVAYQDLVWRKLSRENAFFGCGGRWVGCSRRCDKRVETFEKVGMLRWMDYAIYCSRGRHASFSQPIYFSIH